MSDDSEVIETASGERVKVSKACAEVIDALRVCHRRGMVDATRREVLEVMEAQLQRPLREHVYSGRFSELVDLRVIEKADKRDDRFTLAIRARLGRASRVTAYRMARVVQPRLNLRERSEVIDGAAAGAQGSAAR